ncbi:hypothetical protein PVK06_019163 [Gossypium arboreum]|uniref:Uncharacterized protein n=1 Tax=Gossypium arboreum TaxID=29729 RepID=A0ABR0PJB0_GOSAR|nr:hypothetical protein PVK06_019163 [Gossypium arboreum]
MEGLQVKKSGVWVPIRPLENAFVVNIGDIMEIVSNGVYPSVEHRATVNSVKERLSIVTVYSPRLDGDLGPAPTLLSPQTPPLLKRIGVADYFKGLPVDGSALTGSVQSADWGVICYDLLGVILDNIYGGWIEMGWLQDTFPEPGNDSTEVERIRYARAYIFEMIGGYLMSNLSRNLVHLRWLLKLVDFRATGKHSWGSVVLATLYREMCGATPPNKAKIGDIRLLLDQRSEAQFQWTPYEDLTIRPVILKEFFQNLNIWHVKVSLVNYAIVEMHQTDIVLQQFGFRQPIPKEVDVLDDKHRIDLRQTNTNWPVF